MFFIFFESYLRSGDVHSKKIIRITGKCAEEIVIFKELILKSIMVKVAHVDENRPLCPHAADEEVASHLGPSPAHGPSPAVGPRDLHWRHLCTLTLGHRGTL